MRSFWCESEKSRIHSIVVKSWAEFHKTASNVRDVVFKKHEFFVCFQSKLEGNEMQALEANKHLLNTHFSLSGRK